MMTSWTRPVAHRRPFIASIRPLHSTGVRPSIHDAAASERAGLRGTEAEQRAINTQTSDVCSNNDLLQYTDAIAAAASAAAAARLCASILIPPQHQHPSITRRSRLSNLFRRRQPPTTSLADDIVSLLIRFTASS